jgi:hypothetical protein
MAGNLGVTIISHSSASFADIAATAMCESVIESTISIRTAILKGAADKLIGILSSSGSLSADISWTMLQSLISSSSSIIANLTGSGSLKTLISSAGGVQAECNHPILPEFLFYHVRR